jgi:predicted house-cleaning noncanonical NTP pyrophosphatase (MazG superfamily)
MVLEHIQRDGKEYLLLPVENSYLLSSSYIEKLLESLSFDLKEDSIIGLISKAKLTQNIFDTLLRPYIDNFRDEFIEYGDKLNSFLDDLDELLQSKYIKEIDALFNEVNRIVEIISFELGEYPIKEIKLYKEKNKPQNIDNNLISIDDVIGELE